MRATGAAAPLAFACLALLAGGCWGGSDKSTGSNKSVFRLAQLQKQNEKHHQEVCIRPSAARKAELSTVQVVKCSVPHTEEFYSEIRYSSADAAQESATASYPGVTALESFAKGACLKDFTTYVGVPYQKSSLFFTYMLPSVRSWPTNKQVDCVITTNGQPLTQSVKGTKW